MQRRQRFALVGGITLLSLCVLCAVITGLTGPHFLIPPFSGAQRSHYLWPDVPDMSALGIPQPQAALVSADVLSVHVEHKLSLLTLIFDDDPIYGLDVIYQVHYSDGTSLKVRWSSWRYGLVVGPFVLVLGNGPPGEVGMVESPS